MPMETEERMIRKFFRGYIWNWLGRIYSALAGEKSILYRKSIQNHHDPRQVELGIMEAEETGGWVEGVLGKPFLG